METESIVEILGGRKVLGKTIRSPDDLTHLIRKGLPASSISALAGRLRIGNSVFQARPHVIGGQTPVRSIPRHHNADLALGRAPACEPFQAAGQPHIAGR